MRADVGRAVRAAGRRRPARYAGGVSMSRRRARAVDHPDRSHRAQFRLPAEARRCRSPSASRRGGGRGASIWLPKIQRAGAAGRGATGWRSCAIASACTAACSIRRRRPESAGRQQCTIDLASAYDAEVGPISRRRPPTQRRAGRGRALVRHRSRVPWRLARRQVRAGYDQAPWPTTFGRAAGSISCSTIRSTSRPADKLARCAGPEAVHGSRPRCRAWSRASSVEADAAPSTSGARPSTSSTTKRAIRASPRAPPTTSGCGAASGCGGTRAV